MWKSRGKKCMNQDSLWCHFSVPNGTSNCVHHLFPMQQNLARCYISWAWQNILLPSSERNIKEEQNWDSFWIRLLHRIVHRQTFESDWSRARAIQQAVNWIFKSRFLLICQLSSRVGFNDTHYISMFRYIFFRIIRQVLVQKKYGECGNFLIGLDIFLL